MAPPIYRVADAEPGDVKEPNEHNGRLSRRVPKNIPYVVDNIWAWTRPEGYADRRFSKYGNPSPDQRAPGDEEKIFRVHFRGEHTVCQLQTHEDAKHHPDVDNVKSEVLSLLGMYEWTNRPVEKKQIAGRLFMPTLSPSEVDTVVKEVFPAREDREKLKNEVRFWDHVTVVRGDEFPATDGEVFFEYPGGIELQPIG